MKTALWLCLGMILMACAGTNLDNREQSPHFINGKFNNVNPVEIRSFWEVVWHSLASDIKRAQWPEWIETRVDDKPMAQVDQHETRITFINHATFLIQRAGFNILTDPVFSERTSPFSFIGPKRIHKPGIEIDKLPKIDDHFDQS